MDKRQNGRNGKAMWIEWRKTVSLKSLETTGRPPGVRSRGSHPRNDGKKTSMQFHRPKPLEEQASSLKRRGRRRRRRRRRLFYNYKINSNLLLKTILQIVYRKQTILQGFLKIQTFLENFSFYLSKFTEFKKIVALGIKNKANIKK